MIRTQTIFITAVLALLPLMVSGQTAPQRVIARAGSDAVAAASHVQAPPPYYGFSNNVTYYYNAEWRLWTAGTATLRMESDGTRQKVSGTADSTGVVALLYTVRDRFESHFDRRTFCSEQITKHTEEGFHKKDTSIRFDYNRRKAVLDERNLKNDETKHAEENIPGCVVDVLSGIYYVGSLPLQVGASYTFPLNDGGKMIDVRATVEAREQVKTDAGTFNTLRVRTEDVSGALRKRGNAWVWYTDDPSRMPVQMRARAFWGTLNFRLARVEWK